MTNILTMMCFFLLHLAHLVLVAQSSPKNLKTPSFIFQSSNKYGYPYAIAPTLSPVVPISSRSDHGQTEGRVIKPFGIKLAASEESPKKASPKKYKSHAVYGAASQRRLEEVGEERPQLFKELRSYQEPKYRNLAELRSAFQPRRIDDATGRYAEYSVLKKRLVSPRDPYLSPSEGLSDSFYPLTKKIFKTSSSSPSSLMYGAGHYEDSYYGSPSSEGDDPYAGPSKSFPSPGHYHDYTEDYTIESNKPITGDIRKRLLDYAGASDLYEGEPDYLQEVARSKNKYRHVTNDYHAYGEPGYKSSYREHPYLESKMKHFKKTLE